MLICIAALGAHSLILLLIVGAVNIQPALIFHSRRVGAENIGVKGISRSFGDIVGNGGYLYSLGSRFYLLPLHRNGRDIRITAGTHHHRCCSRKQYRR